MIDGVVITELKVIPSDKGSVLHGIKASESTFSGFGEAYFSEVNFSQIKGWKKHSRMNMNLVVPVGAIKFVVYDDRDFSPSRGSFFEIGLSKANYFRLTIPSGLWFAFQGIGESTNLLMNFSDIPHDPLESNTIELSEINYEWN
ncbi:dTDP-4-dehydrorhamnose 3,5-epimerase [Vibrio lentus]